MEESPSAELLDDTAVSDQPASHSASNGAHLTPDELVAKAIAPVKRQYLRPPPLRSSSNNNVKDAASTDKNNDRDINGAAPSTLVKEKKSKRQLKRERRQVTVPLFISLFVLVVFVNVHQFFSFGFCFPEC